MVVSQSELAGEFHFTLPGEPLTVRLTWFGVATVIRASREMKLSVLRHGDQATVQVIAGTDELPDGRVLGTFMTQMLGKKITQQVHGAVGVFVI